MPRNDQRLRHFLSGVAGFTVSFAAIVSPFAYYHKAHADASRQLTRSIPPAAAMVTTMAAARTSEIAAVKMEAVVEPAPAIKPAAVHPAPLASSTQPAKKEIALEAPPQLPMSSRYKEHPMSYHMQPGRVVNMEATAYCLNGSTASGVRSKYGIVAADPTVLPIGSIVRLYCAEYSGLYTVMDTGDKIKGSKIDIYLTNSKEAMIFGRRKISLEVLRYGWNPQDSMPQSVVPPTSQN